MQDQATSPELPLSVADTATASVLTPAPSKQTRITLTRMESFAVLEKLKGLSDIATTSIEDIINFIRADCKIETTPAIIRSMLKGMGIPHITFRSTPKPSAVLNDEIVARIDGLNSRLEFATNVIAEHVGTIARLQEMLELTEKRMLDQGQKLASLSIDVQKIDRELEAASR